MKKNNNLIWFGIITAVAFTIVITLLIVFSRSNVESGFYNSLSVASLSVAFFSFAASMFFSLAVYLQTRNQNKINESLPKKDDQYIITNYSMFNIEKEISFFSLNEEEKAMLLKDCKFFGEGNGDNLTRFVFLPSNSMNIPTYKVKAHSISFVDAKGDAIYKAENKDGIDADYSSNILLRGYNAICIDIAKTCNESSTIMKSAKYIELELDIVSVFNVQMTVKFFIYIDSEKDNSKNPDKKLIKDLETYIIHHSNYVIENKSIVDHI